MAQNKRDIFNESENILSDFARSISHPARIQILTTLALKNTCVCGDFVNNLPLAQSTVSQHLKELKKYGLIIGEVDGPRSCYCINQEMLKKMEDEFVKFFKKLKTIDTC